MTPRDISKMDKNTDCADLSIEEEYQMYWVHPMGCGCLAAECKRRREKFIGPVILRLGGSRGIKEESGDSSTQLNNKTSTEVPRVLSAPVRTKVSTSEAVFKMSKNKLIEKQNGENVCSICGVCQPWNADGYCRANNNTDPHLTKYGKRIRSMILNPDYDIVNDTVGFSEMSGEARAYQPYMNDAEDVVCGRRNISKFRQKTSNNEAEVKHAENDHIHDFYCYCTECMIGGIEKFDSDGLPTGATAEQPLGMGKSFELPTEDIYQGVDVHKELMSWYTSGGLEGFDPSTCDYISRIQRRKSIRSGPTFEMEYHKPHCTCEFCTHPAVLNPRVERPEPVVEKEVVEEQQPTLLEDYYTANLGCSEYHKLYGKNCVCEHKSPESDIDYSWSFKNEYVDEDGKSHEITLYHSATGSTEEYVPPREVSTMKEVPVIRLLNFRKGHKSMHAPYMQKAYSPLENNNLLQSKAMTSDNKAKAMNETDYDPNWITYENGKKTYSPAAWREHMLNIGRVDLAYPVMINWDDNDECVLTLRQKSGTKEKPLMASQFQLGTITKNGLTVPSDMALTYEDAFQICGRIWKPQNFSDTSKEYLERVVASHEHMKTHTTPFPVYQECEECGMTFCHIDACPPSEDSAEVFEHDEIIMGDVDYTSETKDSRVSTKCTLETCSKPDIYAVAFDFDKPEQTYHLTTPVGTPRWYSHYAVTTRKDVSTHPDHHIMFDENGDIRGRVCWIAFVGSSKMEDTPFSKLAWKKPLFREAIRKEILALQEALGSKLGIQSGGAKGTDELAIEIAKELGIPTREFKPDVQQFADGKWNSQLGRIEVGFRTRNIRLAKTCCKIINFVGKVQKGNPRGVICQHCNEEHYSSGGCWTRKVADGSLADQNVRDDMDNYASSETIEV